MELISEGELISFFEKFDPERKIMLSTGDVIGIIKNQETIDAEPVVHAHWIEENTVMAKFVKCSNCEIHIRTAREGKQNDRYYLYPDEMKFCPSCGAKMDEEADE